MNFSKPTTAKPAATQNTVVASTPSPQLKAAAASSAAGAATGNPSVRIPKSSSMRPNFSHNSDFQADPFNNSSKPFRILNYGKPKTRKTWFSATTALEPYNLRTTILDGDTNTGILNQLPTDALDRIQIAPMTLIGQPTIFPQFIATLKGVAFGKLYAFPFDGRTCVKANQLSNPKLVREDMTYYLVNLDALTPADHIIVDSYTSLVAGANQIYNAEYDVDPMAGQKLDPNDANKYAYFNYHEALLRELQGILIRLPCNVTVIGHAHHYETEISQGKSKQKFGNIQLVSYSGTDGGRAPSIFSDVLYFKSSPNGNSSEVYTAGEEFRIGGSTHVKPGSHGFPGWDMQSFLREAKLQYPSAEQADETYGPWLSKLTGREILDMFNTG